MVSEPDNTSANGIAINVLDISVGAAPTAGAPGRTILSGLTFQAKRGQKVVLYGPSGSGKTTALKAVMGFVEAGSGEVLINGQKLDGRSVWRLRRMIAYVPQEPDMGEGTVEEAIERPFGYKASSSLRLDETEKAALFSRFLLHKELLGQGFSSLSVGEKQRVALVSALLLGRPILLLDEVTSALDAKSRQAVVEHLESLSELTVLAA
jgi:ABC-type multidrug transport system fused ATPase/permease subunit